MTIAWTLNASETASEDFDDETIIIHFRNGTYSSLLGSGAAILKLLSAPRSVDQIVAAFSSDVMENETEIRSQTEAFVSELAELGLIIQSDGDGIPLENPIKEAWQPPAIETYTDLADLMAIDPVHEVALEEGWPHPAAASEKQ